MKLSKEIKLQIESAIQFEIKSARDELKRNPNLSLIEMDKILFNLTIDIPESVYQVFE